MTGLVLPRAQAVVEAGFMPRQPHSQATLGASRLAGLREAESWKKNKYSGRGEEESGNLYASSSVLTNPDHTESNKK